MRDELTRLLARPAVPLKRFPPVLIQGETGTGKGLVAHVIHQMGPRSDAAFVDLNCAAIPDTLLEAELFGYERGAFTDAKQAKAGLLQLAHRGTIFLDEIGLMPEALQVKLLKALEDHSVRRLGGTRPEPADAWVLAATSEDLTTAIRTRRFREDLYHRLAVVTVQLPPLRERGSDIILLAHHYLDRACREYGLPIKALASDAESALLSYTWPGNVRELANVMERVALLSESEHVTAAALRLPRAPRVAVSARVGESVDEQMASVERGRIEEALRIEGGNISRTAARLGLPRNTLRYRMDLERERGITIKAHPVRLNYTAVNGEHYVLNLIDTPGHVDFGYEVTRSLAACEGALLLVDASQGVEAQTLANAYLAVDSNLEVIPVINKIDLPSAQPDECKRQIEDIIGLDASTAILASAKEGTGTRDILEAIIARFHPPKGDPDAPLKALVFDSWYDAYRGVVIVVRVIDGALKTKQKIRLMATAQDYEADGLGVFSPKATPVDELGVGEVGFIVANIKRVSDAKIGDTVTETGRPTTEPFPGFKELKPMVFAGLYPVEGHKYTELREALEKLRLNDASFFYEPETSAALGFGFRCGFLGLLHMTPAPTATRSMRTSV